MTDSIQIYSAINRTDTSTTYSDFKIGNIRLAKHLGVADEISAIDVDSGYARQLLLKESSILKSGRVPLYVCGCCADLGCGATTVLVEQLGDEICWSEFGQESYSDDNLFQSEYMKRAGPYYFNKVEYYTAINPYA